jgi:hypothetical protein
MDEEPLQLPLARFDSAVIAIMEAATGNGPAAEVQVRAQLEELVRDAELVAMERCELRRKRAAQQQQERSIKYQRCRMAIAETTVVARHAPSEEASDLAASAPEQAEIKHVRPIVPKLRVPQPCPVIEEEPSDSGSDRTAADKAGEYGITIDRSDGAQLGIDVDVDSSSSATLLIEKITGGLVQKWNDNNPDQKVRQGDHIVEVNGIRGDRQSLVTMVDECKKNQVLHIKLHQELEICDVPQTGLTETRKAPIVPKLDIFGDAVPPRREPAIHDVPDTELARQWGRLDLPCGNIGASDARRKAQRIATKNKQYGSARQGFGTPRQAVREPDTPDSGMEPSPQRQATKMPTLGLASLAKFASPLQPLISAAAALTPRVMTPRS